MRPTARRLLLAAQLLVVAALALAIEHWWGFARLAEPWRAVPPVLVALVVAAQLASYGLRALRVYLAEPRIPRGAWGKALRLILLNNALNLLLPARTGEASFPLLLQRYFGVPLAEGAGTLLWLRLLDLNVLGVLALLTFAPAVWPSAGPVWTATALVVASIPFAMPLLHQSLSRSLSARTGRASALARQLLVGVPCRARQVLLDLVLTWAAWGVKLAALAAVFAALAALPLKAALLGAIGGDLSTVLPLHTPGGFGSYEAGVIALAAPLAAPSPALLAAAVNLHVLVLGIALAAGALAWLAGVRKSAT